MKTFYLGNGSKWVIGFTLITLISPVSVNKLVLASSVQNSEISRRSDALKEAVLPDEYETWTACRKQEFLWDQRIVPTRHQTLPPYRKLNILGLARTHMSKKMDRVSDEVPVGWKKHIHPIGTVAKFRFIADGQSPFTGLFKGAECGLIRLSLTYDPEKKGVAPGLAAKFFIDGHPSENFSALVSLDGQGKNYNFFANEFSNVIPDSKKLGPKIVGMLFRRVTKHPTYLYLKGLSLRDQKGGEMIDPQFPLRIFLVPTEQVQFPKLPARDVRKDILNIPAGTTLFDVYAVTSDIGSDSFARDSLKRVLHSDYRKSAQRIGQLETTSEFIASEYGDERLFFRHQRFANE